MAQKGAKAAVREGVQVIQGTPTEPVARPTLFLRLLRVGEGKTARTRATLLMVRPGPTGYVVKELIPDMDLDQQAALEKTIAIAKRGEVGVVYLNADLDRIPKRRAAANA